MAETHSIAPLLNRNQRSWTGWLARVLFLAIAYYSTAQLGLLIPSVGPMVCLIWPPAGLAVAVLFRGGLGLWPGVFLGAFITNLGLCGPIASTFIAAGMTLAAASSVWFLKRRQFDREFRRIVDLKSLLFAAMIGSSIAAAAGAASLFSFGEMRAGDLGRTLLNWWLGDAGSVMMIAPFLLSVSRKEIAAARRRGQLRGLLGSFGLLLAACVLLYSGIVPPGRWSLPATFLLMVFVARTAGLYRAWPSTLQVIIVAACVIWNNYSMSGPSVYLESTIRIYAAWAFLVTASIVSLGISGLLAERDSVERKLKTGEETYRALVHDNPALICRFSTDGLLIFANETFRRTFELPSIGDSNALTRNDLRNQQTSFNYFEITGLLGNSKALAELRELDAPERPVCYETHHPNGPNAGRWYRWTARAVDMSSSVVFEYHAVGLDVSDQKRAEAERKTMETQAIQAQHYEAIGMLAGGIAHEFNNILTGLIGNADLALMMLPKSNDVRPMLDEVLRGAQRAAELTKQLSTYAGQTDTHPRQHSVSSLVLSCERLIEVALPKHCTIRFEIRANDPHAVVDESKIRQLLLSLVTNAAESMAERSGRPGEIVVRVSDRSIGSESNSHEWVNGSALVAGEYVQLEVADNGCGMNAATLARVFEPFFSTKFPGRGLGMAAVLGIVQDHAGAIRVTSEIDRGTTVRVLLPTRGTSIDFPTPLPRTIRRSGRISTSMLVKK